MGASEILQLLEKGEKLTSTEICERTGCTTASVKVVLKRLLKDVSVDIEHRPLTLDEKRERYARSLGCKVYLYWLN